VQTTTETTTSQSSTDPATAGDARRREEVRREEVRRDDTVPQIARLTALAAGAIVAIIGFLALMRVDWGTAEVDAPAYDVLGMSFTPVVAGVTAFLGLLLILAAASRTGEGKIALGAVTASLGAAILLVADLENSWQVGDDQGWLALIVGGVFVAAGILTERTQVTRRRDHQIDLR
jgi:hypothetical protein